MIGDDLAQALAALPRTGVIVASDFDGVLAPLVLNPMDATALPGTIESLRQLSAREGVTSAVVSGRDLATLRTLTGLSAEDDVVVIGSHGGETSEPLRDGEPDGDLLSPDQREALGRATSVIENTIARFPQARLERKPAGVVLHTRGLPDDEAAQAETETLEAAKATAGVYGMRGKSVVELSVLEVSKGSVLRALMQKRGAQALVYLGDDVTDETVFVAFEDESDSVTIKVGEGETAARFRVETPQDAADVLAALASA